ncbi:MAG: hypothetical protein M0Z51_12215 [Propionibacterium sp.]|nr:hypothetical protein [Propionibacterium sp.]
MALWVIVARVVFVIARTLAQHGPIGLDAHAYWLAWRGPMYTAGPGLLDAYLYSPAFAQAIWLPSQLPWPVFDTLICVSNALLLAWLLRPVGWKWGVPLYLALLLEVLSGNILVPMAIIAVIGFRYPGAWAFSLLTKVATTMGPIWWLSRREWRPLAIWTATVVIIVGLSATFAPELWVQWVQFLRLHASGVDGQVGPTRMIPLIYRAPIGVALVSYGARRDWRWTIPVGMVLCTPVFWPGTFALLAAIPRIQHRRQLFGSSPITRRSRSSDAPAAGSRAR